MSTLPRVPSAVTPLVAPVQLLIAACLFVATLALSGCGGGGDQEAVSGTTSAGDGGVLADGGTLGDGGVATGDGGAGGADGGGGASVKDGGGVTIEDGGASVKDGGGATIKDGGGATIKDGGGATIKDGGGATIKDGGGAGGADVPDNPNAKYKLCSELFTCVQVACDIDPSPGCEAICTKVAGNAAKAAFSPFGDCMWKTCYPGKCAKTTDKKKCIGDCYAQCGGLLYQCMADGKSGAQHCGQGFECLQACGDKGGDKEFTCSIGCYQQMSPAAQKQFDATFACVAEGTKPNPWTGCASKLLNCASGNAVGAKSCIDVMTCMDDCPKGFEDISCTGKCYGAGTAKAQGDFDKVFECMMKSEQSGGAPLGCLEDFLPCADPKGSLPCLKIWPCTEACKKKGGEEGGCTFECLHQSSYKEAKAFLQLVSCIEGVCKPKCKGEADPVKRKACEDACNKKECATQFKACLG